MSGTERRRAKVMDFVAPHLKPGETVDVVITGAQSGDHPGSKAGFTAQKFLGHRPHRSSRAGIATELALQPPRRGRRRLPPCGRGRLEVRARLPSKLTLFQPNGVVTY
jgi:hypothetical protein